jgi:hypothetical protein
VNYALDGVHLNLELGEPAHLHGDQRLDGEAEKRLEPCRSACR